MQTGVIKYLQRCYSYAIKQNENDQQKTKDSLLAIVPHVFGQHDCCGLWCKFISNPNREYRNLPGKKCLSNYELRIDLDKVFLKQAQNAAQLCANSTSNPNESFNTMVASKAPKSRHYSKSESLDFRIAAAVSQKNMGEGYMCVVNDVAGIPTGKIAVDCSDRKQNVFRKRKSKSLSKESKRRRIELQQSHFEIEKPLVVREGVTYETSVSSKPVSEEDIEEIPNATILSPIEDISVEKLLNAEVCVFDLETTSLCRDCDIVQISAVTLDGRLKFNQYILPSKDISPSAAKVTGITMNAGKLFLQGRPVLTVDIKEGLSLFKNWLSTFEKGIILVGHNIKAFDVKHLLRHAKLNGLDFHFLAGFVDTLSLFKFFYPENSSHSQEALYRKIIGGTYDAHNSLSDVIALCTLLKRTIPDIRSLQQFSYSNEWCKGYVTFVEERDKNIQTFKPLLELNAISKSMAEKAASSGLTYRHLQIAFMRQGDSGLKLVLGEKFGGKVRVTKNARIVSSIIDHFNSRKC